MKEYFLCLATGSEGLESSIMVHADSLCRELIKASVLQTSQLCQQPVLIHTVVGVITESGMLLSTRELM